MTQCCEAKYNNSAKKGRLIKMYIPVNINMTIYTFSSQSKVELHTFFLTGLRRGEGEGHETLSLEGNLSVGGFPLLTGTSAAVAFALHRYGITRQR